MYQTLSNLAWESGSAKLVCIWLQVRQHLVPQGLLPMAGCSPAGLSSALTKRSRRFFGRRQAIRGHSGMALFRWLEACSTGRSSARAVKLGRLGWYVTTSGTLVLQRVPILEQHVHMMFFRGWYNYSDFNFRTFLFTLSRWEVTVCECEFNSQLASRQWIRISLEPMLNSSYDCLCLCRLHWLRRDL